MFSLIQLHNQLLIITLFHCIQFHYIIHLYDANLYIIHGYIHTHKCARNSLSKQSVLLTYEYYQCQADCTGGIDDAVSNFELGNSIIDDFWCF